MRNLFSYRSVMSYLWLLSAICYLRPNDIYASAEQQSNSQSGINSAEKESIVVARIAYYTITKDELEKRLMTELYPYDYDYPEGPYDP